MARYQFGGTLAAWVVSTTDATDEFGTGVRAVVLPAAPITVTPYDAPNGNVVTDLLDDDGVPIAEVVIPTGNPYIPKFSGPNDVKTLWAQAETGDWLPIPRYEDGTETGDGSGTTGEQAVSTADVTNNTTTPQAVSALALTVPAAGTYAFQYDLVVETSNGATDTQWSLVGPTTSSVSVAYRRFSASAGANASITTAFATVGTSGTGGITSNTPYRQIIEGVFVATAAGTLTPQFSPASAGTTVTVRLNSIGRLTPEGAIGGGGGGAGDVLLEGGNTHEYADSQSPPWLAVKRPNDNTDSSVWSNMFEMWYWDTSTNQYRLGWYVNEKGLLRTRGTTPSDVPARIMAHPSQNGNVAVLEVALNDNTVKVFQVFTSQVVVNVPVVVPYLVNPLGERLYWGSADPNTDAAYADYRPDIGSLWLDSNTV